MKEIKQVYQYLTDAFLKDFIEESIDCCEKAIQLIPQFSLSYLMLVLFYLKKNDVDTAQKYYLVFREYNPNLEFEVGYEIEEILTAFILKHFIQLKSPYVNDKLEDLMSIRPPIEKAFVSAVIQYVMFNDISNALRVVNTSLNIFPNNISLAYNKSAILMRSENLEEAWDLYELREKIYPHHKLMLDNVEKFAFQKENINLLVYASAGFGDTIFYARYLKLLQKQKLNLYIYVQSPLKTMFKDMGFNVIDNPKEMKFDYQISFMSLGSLFKTSLATIPFPEGYLNVEKAKILPETTKNKKVGIIWKSGAESNRRLKLEELLEAFASNDFQLYSLQKEVTQEEKDLLTKNNIINLSSELTDFKKTAQFIEELDFIVGCDTAVTNLSLALGKETCVLLPFFADYRWGLLEFWTPWYSSAKLFRQENPDIWAEPIQNLKNYLLKK